jgi:outer membrane protein assembly factor BamB
MSLSAHRLKISLALMALFFPPAVAHAKRGPAPVIAPVIKGGVEYAVSPQPEWRQEEKGTVFLYAKDAKTGQPLWSLELYQIKVNPKIESDVQDVCVSSMRVSDGKAHIRNEKGDEITVDLATRQVIAGAGHVYHYEDNSDRFSGDDLSRPTLLAIVGILTLFCIALLLVRILKRT